MNWVSIHNVLLVEREPEIDEVKRLLLIKNTTICLDII